MPAITGFHHVALSVRDAGKTAAFYTEVFGFKTLVELPDEHGRGAKTIMGHGESRTILGLTVHATNGGEPFTEFRSGLDHLSFGVASLEELQEWSARLDELGVEHSDIRTTALGHLISLRDPDDIQLELWANPA
jgi:glyoxylase I family protein